MNATRIVVVGTPFAAKAIAETLVAMPRMKVRKLEILSLQTSYLRKREWEGG